MARRGRIGEFELIARYFAPLARDIVSQTRGWQVWSVERRENLLEDQSMLDGAKQGGAEILGMMTDKVGAEQLPGGAPAPGGEAAPGGETPPTPPTPPAQGTPLRGGGRSRRRNRHARTASSRPKSR